jgi:hypothetical protein
MKRLVRKEISDMIVKLVRVNHTNKCVICGNELNDHVFAHGDCYELYHHVADYIYGKVFDDCSKRGCASLREAHQLYGFKSRFNK